MVYLLSVELFLCFCLFVFHNPPRKFQINRQFSLPHPVRTVTELSEKPRAVSEKLRILPFTLARCHHS